MLSNIEVRAALEGMPGVAAGYHTLYELNHSSSVGEGVEAIGDHFLARKKEMNSQSIYYDCVRSLEGDLTTRRLHQTTR